MNRTLRRGLPAMAAALLTTALAACGESASSATGGGGAGGADPDTLVFAAVPSEQSTSLQQDYKPMVDYLKANGYCAGACTLDGSAWGYAPVNNAFYDPIRKVCDETKNKNCTSAS